MLLSRGENSEQSVDQIDVKPWRQQQPNCCETAAKLGKLKATTTPRFLRNCGENIKLLVEIRRNDGNNGSPISARLRRKQRAAGRNSAKPRRIDGEAVMRTRNRGGIGKTTFEFVTPPKMVKHPSTRAHAQAATTKQTSIARNSGELEQFSLLTIARSCATSVRNRATSGTRSCDRSTRVKDWRPTHASRTERAQNTERRVQICRKSSKFAKPANPDETGIW